LSRNAKLIAFQDTETFFSMIDARDASGRRPSSGGTIKLISVATHGGRTQGARKVMRSALYYPHTELEDVDLLKTALLLWDRLEFMVPSRDYRPHYEDKLVAEAIELIGVNHCPTEDEKKQAHQHIEEFVSQPLPPPFFYFTKQSFRHDYEIYPQKLLYETFKILQEAQIAGDSLGNADYPVSDAAGLSIMSILADCCAGATRARVTDLNFAYATLTGLLGAGGGVVNQSGPMDEQLVPITLQAIDAGKIDLKSLIAFRKTEIKSSRGHDIRDLRHRYVDRLELCAKDLSKTEGSASDAVEIKRQFADDMRDDLAALREALRFKVKDAMFSKDMLFPVITIGSVVASALGVAPSVAEVTTFVGGLGSIWGLLSTANTYQASRREVLRAHPMAYLHQLTSPGLSTL
jgi:hypothetical protein